MYEKKERIRRIAPIKIIDTEQVIT
jgi:hypothetical protein